MEIRLWQGLKEDDSWATLVHAWLFAAAATVQVLAGCTVWLLFHSKQVMLEGDMSQTGLCGQDWHYGAA